MIRKRLLKPFVINTNPDTVTAVAVLCAIFSGYFFYIGFFLATAIFLALNGFLDLLDGEIAKKGKTTKKGDFIDHTADRISDTAIFLGIAYNPAIPTDLALLALISALLVSYLGTQAQALTSRRMYGGLIGRAERHIVLFAGAIMAYAFSSVFALVFAVYAIIVLSIITFMQRFYALYKVTGA